MILLFIVNIFVCYSQQQDTIVETVHNVNRLPFNFIDRKYKIKIQLMNGNIEKGLLSKVDSNSISIKGLQIPVSTIESFRLKKKNYLGRSIRNGFLIGLGIGVFRGLLTDKRVPGFQYLLSPTEKALYYGVNYSLSGAIIGSIIGISQIGVKIHLDGKDYKFRKIERRLRTYCEIM